MLFTRVRVSVRDQRVFVLKLALAAALWAIGAALALSGHVVLVVLGVLLLGAVYTHWVELQHQCLHHSAFLRPGLHRLVGFPLGAPMLVNYSHYRVRHLQHHRYLGTDQDTEFFGFDTRQELTPRTLVAGLFDYVRLVATAGDAWRSWRGTWVYAEGQIAPRVRRQIIQEYRLMSLLVAAAVVAALLGGGREVLLLWVLPVLLVSTPLHFLVELPEHIGCDNDSLDVLRNTRSITGSRFSEWYTNGNNLHIEHHAAMMVPINQLRGRHGEVRQYAHYVDRSYPDFYWALAREVLGRAARRGGVS
jgi:fatty acid desaturase